MRRRGEQEDDRKLGIEAEPHQHVPSHVMRGAMFIHRARSAEKLAAAVTATST